MSILATWAGYKDGAMVIALLREAVRGARGALFAGKSHLVGWLFGAEGQLGGIVGGLSGDGSCWSIRWGETGLMAETAL